AASSVASSRHTTDTRRNRLSGPSPPMSFWIPLRARRVRCALTRWDTRRYEMGGLAKALKALLKNPHVRSDAPVKVVIALKKELCDTVSRVADTVRAQEKSRAVLRASGLSAHVLRSERFARRHILAGSKSVR